MGSMRPSWEADSSEDRTVLFDWRKRTEMNIFDRGRVDMSVEVWLYDSMRSRDQSSPDS